MRWFMGCFRGWFIRRNKPRAPAVDTPFEREQAFRSFFAAKTIPERHAALRPKMLTEAYDLWRADYLLALWKQDRDIAVWGERELRRRIMLW
jgi:hypothetical protein